MNQRSPGCPEVARWALELIVVRLRQIEGKLAREKNLAQVCKEAGLFE